MLQRESNPGPFKWYRRKALTVNRCSMHVLNLPTYTANLDRHELRVAWLAALAPPTM